MYWGDFYKKQMSYLQLSIDSFHVCDFHLAQNEHVQFVVLVIAIYPLKY